MNTKLIETKSGTFSIIDTDTDAQAVIFLSGLGSFAYDFHFTIKDIESKFRCVAIDRLGLGDSSEPEMLRTPNFGRKSLNEIKEVLNTMSLYLGMEIPNWPPDNIAELSKKLEENNY